MTLAQGDDHRRRQGMADDDRAVEGDQAVSRPRASAGERVAYTDFFPDQNSTKEWSSHVQERSCVGHLASKLDGM